MVSREVYMALDSRAPVRAQPKGREYSQETTQRVQKEFLRRNRLSATNISCVVASVLLGRMLLFWDNWVMFAVVVLGVLTAVSIYKYFCKCPNCSAPLDHSAACSMAAVQGFGTEKCPRCEINLVVRDPKYIPARY
jgi:hypothetical protein